MNDFASIFRQACVRRFGEDHFQYLAMLHHRGENDLALELISRLLAVPPGTIETSAVVDLLMLIAEIHAGMGSLAEAEAALSRAADIATSTDARVAIAISLSRLLVSASRTEEAITVLRKAHNGLPDGAKSGALIVSLASLQVNAGAHVQTLRMIEEYLETQPEDSSSRASEESLLCGVYLAYLHIDLGNCDEAGDLLSKLMYGGQSPHPFLHMVHYLEAVHSATVTGRLLTDGYSAPATATATGTVSGLARNRQPTIIDKPLLDFNASWSPHIAGLFHEKELQVQQRAYRLLEQADFVGAIDAFGRLERLRSGTRREGGLLAALDLRASAIALAKAGYPEALASARLARRRLQLLLGPSSVSVLAAIHDEARLLLDQDEAAQALMLVQSALQQSQQSHQTQALREIVLRLTLILMDVATRTGKADESLEMLSDLCTEATAIEDTAPEVKLLLQCQTALAKAAIGDDGAAESELVELLSIIENDEHADTHIIVEANLALAGILESRKEFSQALSLLQPLIESFPNMNRSMSLSVRSKIAACFKGNDQYMEAGSVYGSSADDLAAWADDKDPDYLDMRLQQADCLLAAGKYKDARSLYRGTWELLHKAYTGRETFYIRAVLGNAACLRRLKDYQGAAFNYRRIYNLRSKSQHMTLEQMLALSRSYAWSLEMSGQLVEAAAQYGLALDLASKIHPEVKELSEELKFRMDCCKG